MDRAGLEKLYGRLKGMRDLSYAQKFFSIKVIEDYNNVVEKISKIINENLEDFKVVDAPTYMGDHDTDSKSLQGKLLQFLSYIEYGYKLSEKVIEIGSVYNSIMDDELKARCSDILSAPSDFDRVINQATLVLEDRIRTKAGVGKDLVGVTLVNKVLNSDVSRTVLLVPSNPEEHEGICHICRGIMMSFRNPTHHFLSNDITREEALKLTAFIDYLLKIIDDCKVIEENK